MAVETGIEKPILTLSGITKMFPGVLALDSVDFELRPGEVHGICGENGAGKSTLIKILSGAYRPDKGEIVFEGETLRSLTPVAAFDLGIHTIYQENTLIPYLTVAENLHVGQEPVKGRFIDWNTMWSETETTIERLKININPRSLCINLGIAEQQTVQIAKALIHNCKVIVMDEPTSSFGKAEIDNLFRIIRMLREEGKSIIYISHHLDEVFEIADRITVLRDGKYIKTFNAKEVDKATLIDNMVGRILSKDYDKTGITVGGESFRVEGLSRGNVVKDISFSARRGEILGIYGMVGAGRTEMARLIFGVDKKTSGKVFVNGKNVTPKRPEDAIKAGVAFITEDRRKSGLIIIQSIENNIVLPALMQLKGLFVFPKIVETLGNRMMGELKIKAPSGKTVVENLSGGNQQKVVVAKWLNVNADVYIFDEPTRGIDVGAKQEIYRLIHMLCEKGCAIIMVSSDMEELLGMSDRIVVLCEGRTEGILNKEDFSQETVLSLASGNN